MVEIIGVTSCGQIEDVLKGLNIRCFHFHSFPFREGSTGGTMDDFIGMIQDLIVLGPVQPQIGLVEVPFDDPNLRWIPWSGFQPIE